MTRSPAAQRIAFAQIMLCVAGIVDAAVLALFHYSEATAEALCTVGGCEAVNTSPYSTVAGIPIALIGLGAYVVIGALAFAATRDWAISDSAPLLVFGLSLVGVLYSIYLTYLELFVIYAVCPWCVASALIIAAIWVLALVDLRRRRRIEAAEAESDADTASLSSQSS